jgi:quaternary ammonium compound-resistance protein SugE
VRPRLAGGIFMYAQFYAEHHPHPVYLCFKFENMYWMYLIIAGLFEVTFASCLGKAKQTNGTEQYLWYGGFVIALTLSMILLMKAVEGLPIGTAYAVWTGIGAVGTAMIGIFVFKEPVDFWRVFFLITLIGSIVGLKAVAK